VIHGGMLYDLIEGQGQDPMSKSCKNGQFQSLSLLLMYT